MKTKSDNLIMQNINILYIALFTALILLIPYLAMQFSDEVNWSLADFITVGVLLFGTGLIFNQVSRRLKNMSHRIVLGIVLTVLLFLVWAELAVGIFGSPFAGS
jgi:hypothetical protein